MALPFFLHLLANPSNDQVDLAESLVREQGAMQKLFGRLNPIPDEKVNYESYHESDWDLLDTFRSKKHIREEMTYFHFSGHGEDGNLIFQSKDSHTDEARKQGLVSILEAFPNLGLVFLNCCTSDHLAHEIAKENRIVIASPFVVPTDLAVTMAQSFYKHLVEDNTIWESFQAAVNNLIRTSEGKYRSLFPDDDEELPDPKEIFQFYPGPEAKAAKWNITRLFELNQLNKEKPKNGSEPNLLHPLLHFNFRKQKQSIGKQSQMIAYLIRGKKEHGIPLIFWMFKEPYIRKNSLRVQINLKSSNLSFPLDSYWTELGKGLGLVPKKKKSESDTNDNPENTKPGVEPEETELYIEPELVIKACVDRLSEPGKDILISVYNAQFYGNEELKKVVTDFWYQLRKSVQDNIFPLELKSRLHFFLILEDDLHGEKTKGLAAEEGVFSFVPEPAKLSKDDLWDFLDRNRYWLLSESYQDNWQKLSDDIHDKCAGIPGSTLQMLCRLSNDKYDKLNKRFIEI